MSWCIYRHTDQLNGMCYIGQTKNRPEERWGKDGKEYAPSKGKKPTKFYQRIQQIGWDNFTHEIIEDNIPTLELANEREKYWIEFYDSYNHGYNSTTGGAGTARPKEKIIGYKIIKTSYPKNYVEIIGEFYSITEIQNIFNIPQHRIRAMLGDPRYSQKLQYCSDSNKKRGYYFCYASDFNKKCIVDTKLIDQKAKSKKINQIERSYKVQRSDGKIFANTVMVCKYYKVKRDTHLRAAIKNHTMWQGYYWKFYVEGGEE